MGNKDIWDIEEMQFDPVSIIHDVLVNWWVILLGAIAAALLVSAVAAESYEPRYTTTATFAVSSKRNSNAYNNWTAAYEMAETLEAILKSNTMKKIIHEELGVTSTSAQISAELLGQTNLLVLRVTADTSKEATNVIRAVMDNYTKVSYYALGNAVMDVLQEPKVPMYPDNSLNVRYDAKRAFIFAAAALTVIFAMLSYAHDTVKTEKEIEKKLDTRSLGAIAYERKYKTLRTFVKHKKIALLVNSPIAGFSFVEAYKKLAVKVDYQMAKYGCKTVVVTSLSENEGKSTVAANLAITLAEQGKRVILVEGDLRRPSQFLIFNSMPEEKQDSGEFLEGNTKFEDILLESRVDGLRLVLSKNCYSSSIDKVGSKNMYKLLRMCEAISDYVVIDSPPVGLIGDAEVLAKVAGSVILVSKQNYMLAEDINEALDSFRAHQAKVVGVVLNKVLSISEVSNDGYYGKYGKYARGRRN